MVWFVAVTNTPGAMALGSALRKAREDVNPGKLRRGSLRRLAAQLGIPHSTLSQWETGKRTPRVEDVARVLTALGVSGEKYNRIMDIARHAKDPTWVTTGLPGISQALSGIMEAERTCETLTVWAPSLIHGLLQTGNYARTIMGVGNRPRVEVETRVTLRAGRRDTLTRKDAPKYLALIGEQALRQNIGGPTVMAEQLSFILKLNDQLDNVTVQVVPIGNGWHDGLSGPFVLYTFKDTEPLVLLEHHRSSLFLRDDEDTNDVADFVDAAENIRHAALNVEDSLALIAEMAEEMERTE